MKQIVIARAGAPDVLSIENVADPQPKAGELMIRVAAAGINFADILARQGIYPDCPPYPCVVGYEVSGVVDAIGEGVDEGWLGKQVLALTDFGGYADMACVDARYVWEKPAALSFQAAASLPLNTITAWGLLMAMGGLCEGETVLIHNIGGGVGLSALDIALHAGATVIGTASGRKHEFLKQRGAHHLIDYTTDNWEQAVAEITQRQGVELIIDPLGGKHWKRSYKALRSTGRLGVFGISAAATSSGLGGKLALAKLALSMPFFHPVGMMRGNRGVFGINIHAMYEESGKLNAWMQHILAGVDAGWLRPHVDRVFSFDEAAQAHAYIEARKNIGKVLLQP